jgi:YfiH family protein
VEEHGAVSGSGSAATSSAQHPGSPVAIDVLRSRLLVEAGFRHGFSTRRGGVSDGPFASLNLGVASAPGEADSLERIGENRRRFGRAVVEVGHEDLPWVLSRQVHGSVVHWSEGPVADPRDLERLPVADAIVGRESGRLLSVRTADCLPILLGCARSGLAAAVHAGWRGLVVGAIPAAIDAMAARGASRDAIVAAIGPAISVARYEVGAEVIEAFRETGLEPAHRSAEETGTKPHLDLAATAREVLRRGGIEGDRLDLLPCCTFAEPDRFFSYRRDGARSGRLAAVIEPRG